MIDDLDLRSYRAGKVESDLPSDSLDATEDQRHFTVELHGQNLSISIDAFIDALGVLNSDRYRRSGNSSCLTHSTASFSSTVSSVSAA